MRIEESFDIAAPVELVFSRMNNVGDVGYCIAGVQRVDVINDRESRWKIEQRVGFMARTFVLLAKITELEEPNRIAFAATGQDVEIVGDVSFSEVESALTRCELAMEIDVVGALAPLVELFAKGPQQALISQTVANLRATLDGAGPSGERAPVAAAAPVTSTGRFSIGRLLAWFRSRRERRERPDSAA